MASTTCRAWRTAHILRDLQTSVAPDHALRRLAGHRRPRRVLRRHDVASHLSALRAKTFSPGLDRLFGRTDLRFLLRLFERWFPCRSNRPETNVSCIRDRSRYSRGD